MKKFFLLIITVLGIVVSQAQSNLIIDLYPRNASILIDGFESKDRFLKLNAGKHNLIAWKYGYEPINKQFNVAKDSMAYVNIKLILTESMLKKQKQYGIFLGSALLTGSALLYLKSDRLYAEYQLATTTVDAVRLYKKTCIYQTAASCLLVSTVIPFSFSIERHIELKKR